MNNPLKYTDPSGEAYYLKQATKGTPDYRASRDYSNNIGRGNSGNYGDITGGGGGAGYSYSWGSGYYYDSAGNIASFDEVYNNQILSNGITIYGGIDPTSIRFGKSHGVSGVWYQTTSVSSQTRIGDVGSSNFDATFDIGVVSTFTASGGGGVQQAGNSYSEALYLANTITSLYDENATRNLNALEREADGWMKATRRVPGSINKAMDANKFTKIITKSVSKKLYGVGLVFSAVDMYQDPTTSNIVWNVADNIVGIAAFVPGLQIPALIYFTGRISYDIYNTYNEP